MKLLNMISNQSSSSNWYIKFFDAFFILIGVGYMLHSLVIFFPENTAVFNSSFMRMRYKYLLIPATMGCAFVIIADKLEKLGKFNAEKAHAIFFGLIRFWLAAGAGLPGVF